MSIEDRLRKIEEKMPTRRPCSVCGRDDAVAGYPFEYHELDGSVTWEPAEPCSGCVQIEAERDTGRVFSTIICSRHTYGLSCAICKECYGENTEFLAVCRERFELGHPEEAAEIFAKYGEEH